MITHRTSTQLRILDCDAEGHGHLLRQCYTIIV